MAIKTDTSAQLKPLDASTVQRVKAARLGVSLDWWSVIVAMVLAALVLCGALKSVAW